MSLQQVTTFEQTTPSTLLYMELIDFPAWHKDDEVLYVVLVLQ